MPFQWLQMRISEESDRRKREAMVLERLPGALEEVHRALTECVENYQQAFGREAAEILLQSGRIRITVRGDKEGKWQQSGRVELVLMAAIPGFQVDRGAGGEPLIVEVGLLPDGKLFYRDRAQDQYVTVEEVTRRVLDRALFPSLQE